MSNSSSDNLFAGLKAKVDPVVVAPVAPVEPVVPVIEPVEPEAPQVSELDMLKNRARLMGLTFSNAIGVEALKAKIQAKLDGEKPAETKEEEVEVVTKPETKAELRARQYKEQMALVRVRITNLNPSKKDLPGEIFTVANSVLGAVRKFVPYGEATEKGYHIPVFIYNQLKEREFLNIKTRKDSRGRTIVETGMAREFALEVLPPLTEKELARLASAQAAAAGND